MKLIPIIFLLILGFQSGADAASADMRVFATVVNSHSIQTVREEIADQNNKYVNTKISFQIGGIPQMSINVKVNNPQSNWEIENEEYILNKEGKSTISLDEKSFYQNRMGTIQINY